MDSTSDKSKNISLFLKKIALHLLLPLSLLSFPFFISYNFPFSPSLFPFSIYAIERKYMFLLSTGILTFLTKNLYSSSSSSMISDPNPDIMNGSEDHGVIYDGVILYELSELKDPALIEEDIATTETDIGMGIPKQNIEVAEKQEEQEYESQDEVEEEKEPLQEDESEYKYLDGVDEEREDSEGKEEDNDGGVGRDGGDLVEASPAEGDEVNMNTDELNEKIEEFIRKMKRELKLEAQQHLITV